MTNTTSDNESGFIPNVPRSVLEVQGQDAAQHLQRFCTADLSDLECGEGREAMFLNTKGKLVGFVEVYRLNERWLLVGSPGQSATLQTHLDRYVVREDVQFKDLSESTSVLVLVGSNLTELLKPLNATPPETMPGSMEGTSNPLVLSSRELGEHGLWLMAGTDELQETLVGRGETLLSPETLEQIRQRNQYPRFGLDLSENNLPQELQRDSIAISFTKGCYLGQETVARIDALGHVNRLLCSLQGQGPCPTELPRDVTSPDQVVGKITSAASIVGNSTWQGTATLQRGAVKDENRLSVDGQSVSILPPVS